MLKFDIFLGKETRELELEVVDGKIIMHMDQVHAAGDEFFDCLHRLIKRKRSQIEQK